MFAGQSARFDARRFEGQTGPTPLRVAPFDGVARGPGFDFYGALPQVVRHLLKQSSGKYAKQVKSPVSTTP